MAPGRGRRPNRAGAEPVPDGGGGAGAGKKIRRTRDCGTGRRPEIKEMDVSSSGPRAGANRLQHRRPHRRVGMGLVRNRRRPSRGLGGRYAVAARFSRRPRADRHGSPRRRPHAALALLRPRAVKMPALKVIAGTVRRLKRESGRAAGQFVQNGPRAQAGAAPATVSESTHRNRHCAQAYGRHGKARYGNPDKDARSGSARKPGDRPGARTDRRWAWLRTIAPARIPPCRFCAGPDPCRPRG